MCAYRFAHANETPSRVSLASIRTFFRTLAEANDNIRENHALEDQGFAIDSASALALSIAIESVSETDPQPADRFFGLTDPQPTEETRPIVITPVIAELLVLSIQKLERLFQGLSNEESGSLARYIWDRTKALRGGLRFRLGSDFAFRVALAIYGSLSWGENSRTQPHGFPLLDPQGDFSGEIESCLTTLLQAGRASHSANERSTVILLAQAVGRAIASFCVSQDPPEE